MVKNQYKKAKKMYDLIGEVLSKHNFTNGPESHLTMMEVAMMERENSIEYRNYKMSQPKHHLKVTKNKA